MRIWRIQAKESEAPPAGQCVDFCRLPAVKVASLAQLSPVISCQCSGSIIR